MKYELQSTQTFNHWLSKLKDRTVKSQLLSRLARVENGNFGDTKTLAGNLFELRCFLAGASECITQFVTNELFCYWSAATRAAKTGILKKPKLFWKPWGIRS